MQARLAIGMTTLALGVAALVAVGGFLLASRLGPHPQPGRDPSRAGRQPDRGGAGSSRTARRGRRPRTPARNTLVWVLVALGAAFVPAAALAWLVGRAAAAARAAPHRGRRAGRRARHRRAGRLGRAGRARCPGRRARPHARPAGGGPPRAGAAAPRGGPRAADAAGRRHHQPGARPPQPGADRRRRRPDRRRAPRPRAHGPHGRRRSPPTAASRLDAGLRPIGPGAASTSPPRPTALAAEHDAPARLRGVHLRTAGPPHARRCPATPAGCGRRPATCSATPSASAPTGSTVTVALGRAAGWAWLAVARRGARAGRRRPRQGVRALLARPLRRRPRPPRATPPGRAISRAASGSPSPARSSRPTAAASRWPRPRASARRSRSGCPLTPEAEADDGRRRRRHPSPRRIRSDTVAHLLDAALDAGFTPPSVPFAPDASRSPDKTTPTERRKPPRRLWRHLPASPPVADPLPMPDPDAADRVGRRRPTPLTTATSRRHGRAPSLLAPDASAAEACSSPPPSARS